MKNFAEKLLSKSKNYSSLEQYQDILLDGQVISKGVRECEKRWDIIDNVASMWSRPFTVLEIGSNLGYFSLKLAYKYECTVVCCEGIYGDWLKDILEANYLDNIILINKTLSLEDIKTLSEVEHFDLVIAMSVAHHIDGEYEEIVSALRSLGDVLVMEIATENNACGQRIVTDSYVPKESKIIGYGDSHLDTGKRPIFMIEQKRTSLSKAYIGTPLDDVNIVIDSSFKTKTAIKGSQRYNWHRGINLKTWLSMNGVYPTRDSIKKMILKSIPESNHGDLYSHNIILQGDDVKIIDVDDDRRDVSKDNESILEVLEDLRD
jgi:2-polyprenyl-3-methyl-5-hydroxy-6-metoxy-1,4-benzoquinol methylase